MAAEHIERMGQRMETRRIELNLSRSEVARRIGGKTNENAVYRWERGKHRPDPENLEAIARALEVDDVAYFMASEPEPGTPDLMAALPNGHEASQLDRVLAEISDLRDDVRELARTVAQQSRELRALRDPDHRKEPPGDAPR